MHGAGNRGLSRGALIRQGTQARFVGRRAQLALFTENLSKDPQSEDDPAEFLFHVRGVGGVGKSTLLRQWQEAARRADAVTAVVDENDVHGVQQALVELARQLAEQAGLCREFDKAETGRPLPACPQVPLPGHRQHRQCQCRAQWDSRTPPRHVDGKAGLHGEDVWLGEVYPKSDANAAFTGDEPFCIRPTNHGPDVRTPPSDRELRYAVWR
ncbi:ATP-binding protein [Streptomyces sp. NPDC046557]|uniref:ATP-binding protein n=1 Tax=Streptomyces sp. NPDC046557 TaxID=3155372 RepID=UPI003402CC9F